jgi:hypothetical protein
MGPVSGKPRRGPWIGAPAPWLAAAVVAVAPVSGHAAGHIIGGTVVDRNGRPVPRAIVSLTPGPEGCPEAKVPPVEPATDNRNCTVELVTDRDGRYAIEYLRDHTGEKMKLATKTDYTLEVFKVGYHVFSVGVPYRRGELEVEPVTMIEETIDVADFPENLDPALYSKATMSSGATYEGQ